MFENTFKNIDDKLYKDDGCNSAIEYIEQTSWILFLKYLDDYEKEKEAKAGLDNKPYTPIVEKKFRWNEWAVPKTKEGKPDHNKAMTGDDLKQFVDNELFPYLKKFKKRSASARTIEYKIGEIFGELKNRIMSGYVLRGVLDLVDELRFQSQEQKHELSHLYEEKIRGMTTGNGGGSNRSNGGQFYTPRPLIKAMVQLMNPKIGDKVYDGACGSCGFLVEAFNHMNNKPNLGVDDYRTLQHKTFTGKENKSLPYIIGTINMILHGVEAPNIIHMNTLTQNMNDMKDSDQFDVILANPPFGSGETKEKQENFRHRSSESAYLFLQHFQKSLKAGGEAGIVIKNTFLSNMDNASIALRKDLLEENKLEAILDLPPKVFSAGVRTVVLFFKKGLPTKKIWYYQLDVGRNLGKTNPLNEKDLEEFVKLYPKKALSENSWQVKVADIDKKTYDLSVKNPNTPAEAPLRAPKEILKEMAQLDSQAAKAIKDIEKIL